MCPSRLGSTPARTMPCTCTRSAHRRRYASASGPRLSSWTQPPPTSPPLAHFSAVLLAPHTGPHRPLQEPLQLHGCHGLPIHCPHRPDVVPQEAGPLQVPQASHHSMLLLPQPGPQPPTSHPAMFTTFLDMASLVRRTAPALVPGHSHRTWWLVSPPSPTFPQSLHCCVAPPHPLCAEVPYACMQEYMMDWEGNMKQAGLGMIRRERGYCAWNH